MIAELKELKSKSEALIIGYNKAMREVKTNEQALYYRNTITFEKGQLNMLNLIIYKYEKELTIVN